VLNGLLLPFVKSAVKRCGIINESLRAQKPKRGAACYAQAHRRGLHRSNFVKDISSHQAPRDTRRKEYRFKQFLA
jgi:hypothetical protein